MLSTEIMRLFVQHRERYGSPRLYRPLVNAGWSVSRRRVARLMRAAGLRAKAVRGYRAKVNIHQLYARHPNRLWTTDVTGPNQVWVGDITYLKVGGSWRYLAIVMDQYTRRILAWSLTRRRTAAVTSAVLALAAAAPPGAWGDLPQRSRLGVHGRGLLRDRGAPGHAAERERQRTGRQRARRVVLSLAQGRAHTWSHFSNR